MDKVKQALLKWAKESFLKDLQEKMTAQQGISGELPIIDDDMAQAVMDNILSTNNRLLYTFYDGYGIIMYPSWVAGKFIYNICASSDGICQSSTESWSKREEAENHGFEQCRILLNDKL